MLLAAGCCHCAAPYDYCQPTFLADPSECCQPDARMNSVFNPMQVAAGGGPLMADGEMVSPGVPTPANSRPAQPPDSSGSPSDMLPDTNVPMNAPHAEIQSSATQAIPVSQDAGRRPLLLRR